MPSPRISATWNPPVDSRINFARVVFVNLPPVGFAERHFIDVSLRIVVVVAGGGIDAADSPYHLRSEQDVIDRNDLEQQIDSGLVVDAGVEEHVFAHHLVEWGPLQILCETTIASPVIWDGAAAVRDDESNRRKVLEDVGGDELHERRCFGVDVVRA